MIVSVFPSSATFKSASVDFLKFSEVLVAPETTSTSALCAARSSSSSLSVASAEDTPVNAKNLMHIDYPIVYNQLLDNQFRLIRYKVSSQNELTFLLPSGLSLLF